MQVASLYYFYNMIDQISLKSRLEANCLFALIISVLEYSILHNINYRLFTSHPYLSQNLRNSLLFNIKSDIETRRSRVLYMSNRITFHSLLQNAFVSCSVLF